MLQLFICEKYNHVILLHIIYCKTNNRNFDENHKYWFDSIQHDF